MSLWRHWLKSSESVYVRLPRPFALAWVVGRSARAAIIEWTCRRFGHVYRGKRYGSELYCSRCGYMIGRAPWE